jgi:class 3 adenylate cyclase
MRLRPEDHRGLPQAAEDESDRMSELDAKARARLPNSAFAYIDAKGRRRLPINDEAHVRNALARFSRTKFDDDASRERARKKLLNAAKKYGIVPIGFITGELQAQGQRAAATAIENARQLGAVQADGNDARTLPTGDVTFLLSDIEDSTGLLSRLGERYGPLLAELRRMTRTAVLRAGGHEVDARADEFFAVFERAPAALEAALAVQRAVRRRDWPEGLEVRLRMGIHSGRPVLTESGYIGLPVHTAARVCSAAHGGQILLSGAARQALQDSEPAGVELRSLGRHRLHGLPEPEALYQAQAPDLPTDFPAPRTAAASFEHRTGHWRPATTVAAAERRGRSDARPSGGGQGDAEGGSG